jgi:hypothetical protein
MGIGCSGGAAGNDLQLESTLRMLQAARGDLESSIVQEQALKLLSLLVSVLCMHRARQGKGAGRVGLIKHLVLQSRTPSAPTTPPNAASKAEPPAGAAA